MLCVKKKKKKKKKTRNQVCGKMQADNGSIESDPNATRMQALKMTGDTREIKVLPGLLNDFLTMEAMRKGGEGGGRGTGRHKDDKKQIKPGGKRGEVGGSAEDPSN